MELEYQTQAKIQELERETAHIRLAAAADRASRQHRRADPKPKRRTATAMPLRLLRVLRPTS